MSLFSDIWDWMKSLVQDLINASLTTFKYWVNKAIKTAIDAVDWVITNVYEFIDNSIHYIDESINYWGDQVTQFIDNSIHYIDESINYWGDQVDQYITNVTEVYNQYVTNVNNTYKTFVTNVVGADQDWVRNFFKLMDPKGFLKDPLGYIGTAFNTLINPWAHGMIKSFWEGLEEGLAEEVA